MVQDPFRVGCRAKLSSDHDNEIVIHGLDDLREAVEKLTSVLKLEERVAFLERGHAQVWGSQWPAVFSPNGTLFAPDNVKTISCGVVFPECSSPLHGFSFIHNLTEHPEK